MRSRVAWLLSPQAASCIRKHDVGIEAKRFGIGEELVKAQATYANLQLAYGGLRDAEFLCHVLLREARIYAELPKIIANAFVRFGIHAYRR